MEEEEACGGAGRGGGEWMWLMDGETERMREKIRRDWRQIGLSARVDTALTTYINPIATRKDTSTKKEERSAYVFPSK
jgi:hypothetical protein